MFNQFTVIATFVMVLVVSPCLGVTPEEVGRAIGDDLDHNRENALRLAFLYQMTGKSKYAEKAFEFADVVCDVPNWDDRAHKFPIFYSRVMPYNVPDDQAVFNFDLYAAHIAHRLAVVYDWIYDRMDVRQRDRIRGALLEKAVLLVRGNWDYHWWAWAYRCNLPTRCASGVGMAALALLTEDYAYTISKEGYNEMGTEIYPNPASTILNVKGLPKDEDFDYQIINVVSDIVKKGGVT